MGPVATGPDVAFCNLSRERPPRALCYVNHSIPCPKQCQRQNARKSKKMKNTGHRHQSMPQPRLPPSAGNSKATSPGAPQAGLPSCAMWMTLEGEDERRSRHRPRGGTFTLGATAGQPDGLPPKGGAVATSPHVAFCNLSRERPPRTLCYIGHSIPCPQQCQSQNARKSKKMKNTGLGIRACPDCAYLGDAFPSL